MTYNAAAQESEQKIQSRLNRVFTQPKKNLTPEEIKRLKEADRDRGYTVVKR